MTNLQQVLIHESGHVLGVRLANGTVTTATIVPSVSEDGYVQSTVYGYENTVLMTLMGHAAELEFGFKERYWGIPFRDTTDYAKAKAAIVRHIKHLRCVTLGLPKIEWDVQPRFTTTIVGKDEMVARGSKCRTLDDGRKVVTVNHVQRWRSKLRVNKSEWKPILDNFERKARRLAKKHRAYIETVAQLLSQKQTLRDEDVPPLTNNRINPEKEI